MQQVPGAFDVGGGERLAVMPFDALAQLEGQLLAVLAPRPARRRDRARSIARLFCGTCWSNMTRLLNTPIIGTHGGDRRFLVDRHAGRAVEIEHLQDAARFLRQRRIRRCGTRGQQTRSPCTASGRDGRSLLASSIAASPDPADSATPHHPVTAPLVRGAGYLSSQTSSMR